jgi:hypothetical protein
MINYTPWISRNIAGAKAMQEYGAVYDYEYELVDILQNFNPKDTEIAYNYVLNNHLIEHTINDIEDIWRKK